MKTQNSRFLKSLPLQQFFSTAFIIGGFGLLALTFQPIAQAETPPASGNTLPGLNSAGVAVIDLPSSTAESIRLDIKQARFASHSVGRMILDAQGVDFKKGALTSLGADIADGNFDNVLVDQLKLDTSGFSFDSLELLNHRRFVLDQPINAKVFLKISEKSLNNFITNPKTMEKLQKAVSKKTGNFNLITFSNPTFKFTDRAKVRLTMDSSLGNAVAVPMEFNGNLNVENGKLVFNNLKMTSNGVQLPVDISDIFQKKLNELVDLQKLGKNNFVIHADKMNVSNHNLEINGTAALTRLEFGN
jgi:hypothetical protein